MSYFALNDYLSNGVQLTYAINWKGAKPSTTEAPYLSRDHVKVYEMELQEDDTLEVVRAITAFTFIDALTINLAAPVALNRYVRVVRETPSDYNLTRYTNTLVRPSDFEVTQRQLLFIAQETQDKAGISNLPFDITMDANRAEDAAEAAEVSAAEAAAEAALAASLVGTIHLKFSTYAAQIADTSTYVNGQIADVLGYHATADGGGMPMVWDAASTATHNGGTVRKPTAVSGAGRWLAINKYTVNVRHFGAKGDNVNDDAGAIQAALDYCYSVGAPCFMTAGIFRTGSTIYVPWGVDFHGSGTRESSTVLPTVIKPLNSFTAGDIIRLKNTFLIGSRRFWAGKIRDIHLIGNTSASSQWAISCRDSADATVALQDTSLFCDLLINGCKSGGIEVPNGALPLMFSRIKLLWNDGYGIKVTSGAYLCQSLNFTDISGDGNNGGLLYFKDLDANGSVAIINLKSERRVNDYYGGVDCQENAIVFDNCNDAPITILGATHISSVPDGVNFKKPADLIKVVAGSPPRFTWQAVAIRVRGTDTGVDPFVVANGSSSVPYTQVHGFFAGTWTFGAYSSNNTLKGVFGTGGAFVPCGPANSVFQIQGSTPAVSLHETDAPANEKTWSLDASSGALRLRAVDDAGAATVLLTLDRSGGSILKIEAAVPVMPSVYTIATLPVASTATNALSMISDPAGGKGRPVYSDGANWRYISDSTTV